MQVFTLGIQMTHGASVDAAFPPVWSMLEFFSCPSVFLGAGTFAQRVQPLMVIFQSISLNSQPVQVPARTEESGHCSVSREILRKKGNLHPSSPAHRHPKVKVNEIL